MSLRSNAYVELVVDNADFRKLYFGEIVSLLGDWFNYIAVQTLIFQLTHSSLAAGLAIITSSLPAFFLTPIAGSIVDRYDRRKIMIIADLSRAFLALGMIFVRTADQIPLIYVLMTLLVVFSSFFNPALSAAVPNLVRRDQLLTANALSNGTWGVMLAAGTFVGGVTIAIVGIEAAFVVNSISFLFSALMLWLIRKPFAEHRASISKSLNPFRDFAEGLRYAWERPQILLLLLVKMGGGLAGGVILLLTVFSFDVFENGAWGIGLLQLARGLGIMAGPLLAARYVMGNIGRAQQAIMVGFFVTGVAYVAFGASPTVALAMVAVFIAHMGWGSNWTLSAAVLQRLTPDEIRGRIFSIDIGLLTLSLAFSTFVTGWAADNFDPRVVALMLGAVFIVFGACWSFAVLRSQRRAPRLWYDGAMQSVSPIEEMVVAGE